MEEHLISEQALTDALFSYTNRGVGGSATLVPRIQLELARTSNRFLRVLPIPTRSRGIALLVVAATLVTGTAAAAANGIITVPIIVHYQNHHGTSPGASTGGPSTAGPSLQCRPGLVGSSIQQVQSTVPYHLYTLADYAPSAVPQGGSVIYNHGQASMGSPEVPPGGVGFWSEIPTCTLSPASLIALTYYVDGVPIEISEQQAENPNGPLVLNSKASSAADNPTQTVQIDGSSYQVAMAKDTSDFPCAVPTNDTGVSWSLFQMGSTVLSVSSVYPLPKDWLPGTCMPNSIPWSTFVKVLHDLK